MTALVAAISGVYGLIIGSFLNVVIWRVPRKESIVKPPSHCPVCDAKIANRDNVPIVSWLLLRGRCRNCGTAIAGAIAFAVFFVIHIVSPKGMGFGDVRLSFLLGLGLGWLGWGEVAGGLFAGFLYGAVVGVALIAVRVRGRKQQIPFGPFLAAGATTFVLFGEPIVDWYRHLGR